MNDQDQSLSLSDPDRSLVLSHFLTNFLQNLASCHTALTFKNIFVLITLKATLPTSNARSETSASRSTRM
jgi:hypothetical protein